VAILPLLRTSKRKKMEVSTGSNRPDTTRVGPRPYAAASFGTRFLAFGIDLAVLGCIYSLLLLLTGFVLLRLTPADFTVITRVFSLYLVFVLVTPVLLPMIYFSLFHAVSGRTIGKLIMGIQVVAAGNGLLTPGESFLRWVGYLLSALPAAAGFLWSVLDRQHDAWHDKLAGSHVISIEMT
jgi:uncharacterized RDD family membrane protein YckC